MNGKRFMRVTGLIVEYNPFHNGHQYHMDSARRQTGADGIVAVMSGDYVQRGLPAMVDKYRRTRMALEGGADVVIELPVAYATGSAECFAAGAVTILKNLGCVTDLVYGCECADANRIAELAKLLAEEPEEYREFLQEGLRQGLSFPAARSRAVGKIVPEAEEILSLPNNILAVEYQKALIRLGSAIQPHGLIRKGDGYHKSASRIRQAMASGDMESLHGYMPEFSEKLLDYHMTCDDFSAILNYRLTFLSEEELAEYGDVTPELASRIYKNRGSHLTFSEMADTVKSRNYTLTRVQRALLHIVLGIKKEEVTLPFVRVLGFRRGTEVLNQIKHHSSIPMLTKMAADTTDAWAADRIASDIYNQMVWEKYRINILDEYHAGPVIL